MSEPKMQATMTIEKTSKRLKLRLVIYSTLLVVGLVWLIFAATQKHPITDEPYDMTKPTVLFVVAAVGYLVTRVRIWWNHG